MTRISSVCRRCCSAGGYVAVIALSLLSACGPRSGPPAADSCGSASSDGITSLDIGPNKARGSFVAWADGDSASYVTGGQGAPMFVFRIAVAGPNPPSCLDQRTYVAGDADGAQGVTIGHDLVPRKTYAQPDGSRVTDDIYIVLDYIDQPSLAVTTIVGTHQLVRYLGALPPRDASVPAMDLGPSDLGHD